MAPRAIGVVQGKELCILENITRTAQIQCLHSFFAWEFLIAMDAYRKRALLGPHHARFVSLK